MARPAVSVDLTPEEFAGGLQADAGGCLAAADDAPPRRVSVLVAQHLGDDAGGRVRDYARHLAVEAGRVGLIELDDDGVRLVCFDASPLAGEGEGDGAGVTPLDAKRVSQAVEEMSWDVDRWLVFAPPGARSPAARDLLAAARHWVLLSTADPDGVVAAYRAIKGLSDLNKPTLTLAVFGAAGEDDVINASRKLSRAARQFLNFPITLEAAVTTADGVAEHVVLDCRREEQGGDAGPHWAVVTDLIAKSVAPPVVVARLDDACEEDEQPPQPRCEQPSHVAADDCPIESVASSPHLVDRPDSEERPLNIADRPASPIQASPIQASAVQASPEFDFRRPSLEAYKTAPTSTHGTIMDMHPHADASPIPFPTERAQAGSHGGRVGSARTAGLRRVGRRHPFGGGGAGGRGVGRVPGQAADVRRRDGGGRP